MSKDCLRMCLGCRARKNKDELSRFVLINNEIMKDDFQKYNARGFYLCKDSSCIKKILKSKTLTKKLNRNLTETEINILISSIE